jgi:cytochrome P450
MRVTLGVVAEALLGVDIARDIEDVGRSLAVILADFSRRFAGFFPLPLWVPTPNNLRGRAAIRRLERIIRGLIVERRAAPSDRPDLLARLVAARDNGMGMTDRQVRDELMTLLLAGHDTTANALTWTLWLLSRHPAAEDRVVCELGEVLGGRTPTAADLPRLRYLDATLRESMRVYPPVYAFGREPVTDGEIGGFPIRAGTNVLMSQWVVHRDPRFFDDPDAFRPERWLDGLADRLPPYAYFPFGGGPRVCIGNTFATTEALLVLATLLPRFRLRIAPGATVTPWPSVTLRPRDGLPMVLAARATIPAGVEKG